MPMDQTSWKEKSQHIFSRAREWLAAFRRDGIPLTTYSAVATTALCPLVLSTLHSEGRIFLKRGGGKRRAFGGERIPLPREVSIEMKTMYEQVCDWENLRRAYKKGGEPRIS